MEIKGLTDYILVEDNFVEKNASNKFEEITKSGFIKFKKAKIVNQGEGMVDENIRKTELFGLSNFEGRLTEINLCNLMVSSFERLIYYYMQKTNTQSISAIKDLQILKYEKNGFYRTHIDHGSTTPRTLSIVYFVNEDYKGGNLIFELPNNQNMKIIKKRNRCVIWPSNFLYPHKVEPVEEGTKYSVVAWTL